MAKFIFVTGGVVSGLGKGISAASVGRLLKDNGYSVFMQKFDPYLNVDPGTMSPFQHGEVYVTKDGGETDLDLGHYERFIDEELTKDSSITSGRIYNTVIGKERAGRYDGKTVQVIPHITDEIKDKVYRVALESEADFIITEIGGTVGDIESLPFIEAIRQIHSENPTDVLFMHTVLVPVIPGTDELKTKPTQHSYKELMSYGIKPDVIILRAQAPVTQEVIKKIALFCDVPQEAIVESKQVELIYEVPLVFHDQQLDAYILKHFGLTGKQDATDQWKDMCQRFKNADKVINIALVGKYTKLPDAYLSVNEALYDAGYNQGARVNIEYISSETVKSDNQKEVFANADAILVPGGFGTRGLTGMIRAIQYARENKVPFFGICLGMQLALIEFARNVIGLEGADSSEFDLETEYPVIELLDNQEEHMNLGGTLRLGNSECYLSEKTLARKLYGEEIILERHRHRYEFNKKYTEDYEKAGLTFSGRDTEQDLVEIIEIKDHPYFIASQYHPEFKSRPNRPHPLFMGFIEAALKGKEKDQAQKEANND